MSCSVYVIDLMTGKRTLACTLRTHTHMSTWLRQSGNPGRIYEIWKIHGLHSRWCWKPKKKRWGRMATPRRKPCMEE